MNAFERIEAVLALEMPDRVPLSPLLDHWAATYTGITNAELMTDPEKRIRAVLKTACDFRWDMSYIADTANAALLRLGVPQRLKQPGKDLPENSVHQFDEQGFMTVEDYDLLESRGLFPFLETLVGRIYPEMTLESALAGLAEATSTMTGHFRRLEEAGIVPAVGFICPGVAFEYLSFARGITEAFMDLRRRPEKILAAANVLRKEFLNIILDSVAQTGVRRVFFGCSRSAPVFISPRHFEELVLPDLEFYVDALLGSGITPWFHMDADWTKFLHYFQRFPRGKCVAEFDGFTDIFQAKKILGNTMVIKGDVPAALLASGSRDEVLAYTRRLVEEVGRGGGFILASGCSLPANAKEENVSALTEAVEEWGWY